MPAYGGQRRLDTATGYDIQSSRAQTLHRSSGPSHSLGTDICYNTKLSDRTKDVSGMMPPCRATLPGRLNTTSRQQQKAQKLRNGVATSAGENIPRPPYKRSLDRAGDRRHRDPAGWDRALKRTSSRGAPQQPCGRFGNGKTTPAKTGCVKKSEAKG